MSCRNIISSRPEKGEIILEVQGRDGRRVSLVAAAGGVPVVPNESMTMLRLTLPALDPTESASPAASFLRLNRDPANSVVSLLDPDSWLELENTSRAGRIAVVSSGCWADKEVYLRRRRALCRVSRGFQVCVKIMDKVYTSQCCVV